MNTFCEHTAISLKLCEWFLKDNRADIICVVGNVLLEWFTSAVC